MSWRVAIKCDGSEYFANIGKAWPTKEGSGISVRINARVMVGPNDLIVLTPDDDEKGGGGERRGGGKFGGGQKAGKGTSKWAAPAASDAFGSDDDIPF